MHTYGTFKSTSKKFNSSLPSIPGGITADSFLLFISVPTTLNDTAVDGYGHQNWFMTNRAHPAGFCEAKSRVMQLHCPLKYFIFHHTKEYVLSFYVHRTSTNYLAVIRRIYLRYRGSYWLFSQEQGTLHFQTLTKLLAEQQGKL